MAQSAGRPHPGVGTGTLDPADRSVRIEPVRSRPQALADAESFFHVRRGALTTKPFLSAAAVTRIYFTSPSTRALTRWRLGKTRPLVIAVMCVPIPPLFLDFPLRQIMLPFMGRLPVSSQILAIQQILFYI